MATSTGFWEDDAGSTSTYSLLSARSPNRYHLTRLLRKSGMRQHGEILSSILTDATAGQTPQTSASVITSQIAGVANTSDNVQGGVRTVNAQERMDNTINNNIGSATPNTARAVTAADVTELQKELIPSGSRSNRAPTYPTDASGNGGGGKGENI